MSAVTSSYWVRWLFLSEDPDNEIVHVARGAPRRWFAQHSEPFGISNAPTRFGQLSYSMQPSAGGGVQGSVSLVPWAEAKLATPLITLKLRSAEAGKPLQGNVELHGVGSVLVAWHAGNETAVVRMSEHATSFTFTSS